MDHEAKSPDRRLRQLPVRIEVVLGDTMLTLAQLLVLQPGNTILLRQGVRDRVRGFVGRTEVFRGDVYTQVGRFAVKIVDAPEKAGPPAPEEATADE